MISDQMMDSSDIDSDRLLEKSIDVALLTLHMKAATYAHRSPVNTVGPALDVGSVFFVYEGTWAPNKQRQLMMAWSSMYRMQSSHETGVQK